MAGKPGLVIDKGSADKVFANLRKIAGNAKKVVGTLHEMMEYAANVELGMGRNKSKPHMRPAYAKMIVDAVPEMEKVLKRALNSRPHNIDIDVFNAVGAAMYKMEAHRLAKLRELVYTAERLAKQRKKDYTGYKLTGNLANNRKIIVEAIGGGIRKQRDGKGKLGRAVRPGRKMGVNPDHALRGGA